MAYDEGLAQRIRDLTDSTPDLAEKSMFGGLAFLLAGHLAVAANSHGALMVRVAPEHAATLLDPPRVRAVVMRGRTLRGWLDVSSDALDDDESLRQWVALGMSYAAGQPPRH